MLTNTELARLSVAEKRQIARALLQSALDAPRSFPLSYAQEQLWFMDKLEPGSPVYNIPLYVPFQGPFDAGALKTALDTLMRRHDMLRVHFAIVDGEPRQIVEPHVPIELPLEDLSRLSAEQRHVALGQLLNQEVQRPFDLSAGICVRYKLFRLDPNNHILSVTMHHIITDAWSLGIYVAELKRAYNAYRGRQRSAPLAPQQLEYSDYAQWQRTTLRGLRWSKLVQYWTEQLADVPQVLHLPTDHPRPKDRTFNGTVLGFVYPDALSDALIAFSRERRVTPFMVLLACYAILLYRYTGQEDIAIGAPVANRGHPALEQIIGLFVNTLILRVRLHEADTFAEILQRVNTTAMEAFEHQALPFDKLVDELHVQRVPGYPLLYQVVFNFQNASLIESDNPLAEGQVMHDGEFPFVHSNTAKVDVNLTLTQSGESFSGGIEYNTDIFERETITAMIAHFQSIVETVVGDPAIPIIDIALGGEPPGPAAAGPSADSGYGDFVDGGEFSFDLDD